MNIATSRGAAEQTRRSVRHRRATGSTGWRSRLRVLARVLAAVLGGYALAALSAVAVALLYRAPREEAVLAASLPAFLVYAGAVLWAFAARSAVRAWLGIGVPAVLLGALVWWLKHPGATP